MNINSAKSATHRLLRALRKADAPGEPSSFALTFVRQFARVAYTEQRIGSMGVLVLN